MPQGLQVWNAAGTLIVDTRVSVLRELTTISTSATTTTTQTQAITVDPTQTVVGGARLETGADFDAPPSVSYNSSTGNLEYKWGSTGSKTAKVQALVF